LNVGDTVNLQFYAAVGNNDNNNFDDAIGLIKYGFQSTSSSVGAVQGTFGALTFNTQPGGPVNAALSSVGVETNGQAVGDITPNGDPLSNSFWANSLNNTAIASITTGTNPYWWDGPIQPASPSGSNNNPSPSDFILGTITWTATSVNYGNANVSYELPAVNVGTSANKTMTAYIEDAGQGNANPVFYPGREFDGVLPSDLTLAPGVVITAVPEPAGLGILGIGLMALGMRGRRQAVKTKLLTTTP